MDNNVGLANSMECEECGGTDFYKEVGGYFCKDCQTQSQQVVENIFEQGDEAVNEKSTRKTQEKKSKKSEDLLTSWECYNYILKGLTEELISLGAKQELRTIVKFLWMKYLHKCQVFDIHSNRPPKISVLGPKKDLAVLYNVKKRKRSSSVGSQSKKGSLKKALINSQYEELSQSQSATQSSSHMHDTLSSLKSNSEASGSSDEISYNKYSNSELKRMMSREHRREHKKDIDREMTCHKLTARSFRAGFLYGPTNLTSFTLYGILYIGLLIIDDVIQLGDMLRFIREGHLSFSCYRHFFPEDISEKALNLPQRMEKLFSHVVFRKRCSELITFLDVSSYIQTPDLLGLCERYCKELNLPDAIFQCAVKIILKTEPKMKFSRRPKMIGNYEARAMSFIVFTLKLMFGLDGETEGEHSKYADILNDLDQSFKMFNFMKWLQFIGYRNVLVKKHHMPTALKDGGSTDSDTYLEYLKNQKFQFKGSCRQIHSEVKDYLQVLEKLIESSDVSSDHKMIFEPSLVPFSDYTNVILEKGVVHCKDVISEIFTDRSLEFLLKPEKYLELVGTLCTKNGGANENIITQDVMYLYKNTIHSKKRSRKTATVRISDDDKYVKEYLEANKRPSLMTTNAEVLLSNWQKGNEKEFSVNKDLLKIASQEAIVDSDLKASREKHLTHYNAFERYWLNIPINTIAHYFSKQDVNDIVSKYPHTFRVVLKECSRVVEQDYGDFLPEFLVTELYLVYIADFGVKSKTNKSKGLPEIRKVLENYQEVW